jgi:hypothetical protein
MGQCRHPPCCVPAGKNIAAQWIDATNNKGPLPRSGKLYVNTVTTSKLLHLDLAKDGKVTGLKLSRPLDGKRLIGH